MKKKNIKNSEKSYKLAQNWQEKDGNSDVLGSWTGTPQDEDEKPIQDADDL